jgi:hypothetical protein
MPPHPTEQPGLIRIPAPNASSLKLRLAPLSDRDRFDPSAWPEYGLRKSTKFPGWQEIDVDTLALADGLWE